mgnify:CR=1 FL=1
MNMNSDRCSNRGSNLKPSVTVEALGYISHFLLLLFYRRLFTALCGNVDRNKNFDRDDQSRGAKEISFNYRGMKKFVLLQLQMGRKTFKVKT